MAIKYHTPVLLKESIEGLKIKPDGIYVDATFGGGGHSKEILKKLSTGKLFAFDIDEDAAENAKKFIKKIENKNKFFFMMSNFKYIKNFLRYFNINTVDGIIADLGVSSHQFDTALRGFSFRFEGNLDMRMNKNSELTAEIILNEYPEKKLIDIFKIYGELKNTKKLVNTILQFRKNMRIKTIADLKKITKQLIAEKFEFKYLAKVFQALRIEVNKELDALKKLLEDATYIIKEKGRLVILTYHSLEDRPVKNFMKTGNIEGKAIKDFYGNINSSFIQVNKKVIIPSNQEVKENNRARSAKLRIAERTSKKDD